MSPFSFIRDTLAAVMPASLNSERRTMPRSLNRVTARSCWVSEARHGSNMIRNVGLANILPDTWYHRLNRQNSLLPMETWLFQIETAEAVRAPIRLGLLNGGTGA